MTYIITSQCIDCRRCESVCPNGAITRNEHQYQINSERCTDCVGHYSIPQCWSVCPTSRGCVPDLSTPPRPSLEKSTGDYWETWFTTYDRRISRLKATHQSDYWQHWFDAYSQALSRQLLTHPSVGVHS